MKPTDRALSIFEAFAVSERPLTLSELAEVAGLPVSTCHGIVATLVQRGYLYLTSRRKDLYPTRRLADMAERIGRHDPYLERLEAHLEVLREETQETVIVGKRQHDEIVYLSVLEGPQTIRYSASAGSIKPLHSTSIGKALLSSLDDATLRAWLKTQALAAVTSSTLTSATKLINNLRDGRERGFFVTRGESVSDVLAVAAPVVVQREVLGIAIAGPMYRMDKRIDEMGAMLLRTKALIEASQI
ncbi:IclR family transcriptional regulator [Caballeronia sp. LjRoot29]|uniref:IclR family transcriptional regulator n=1 Tax=Caballeronia sp. LjRoot29 TaxID=3342315 RepID=UPI003ECFFD64